MSLAKLLMIVVGIAVLLGIVGAATGILKMDKEGNVSFSQEELNNATTASEMSKANMLMQQTKYREAIDLYSAYLLKNPQAPDAAECKFRIAKCYEADNQQGLAIRYFKEYLKEYPKDSVDRRNTAQTRISFLENAGYKESK